MLGSGLLADPQFLRMWSSAPPVLSSGGKERDTGFHSGLQWLERGLLDCASLQPDPALGSQPFPVLSLVQGWIPRALL